jgi:hypothetical protein
LNVKGNGEIISTITLFGDRTIFAWSTKVDRT